MATINDESAAKAILKGSIRELSDESRVDNENFIFSLKIVMEIKAKTLRNKKLLMLLDKSFSYGLIAAVSHTFKGIQKRIRKSWIVLSVAQYTACELKTVHLYPVSIYSIDLWQSRDIRGYDTLFYVSKHALERVALRNQESSLMAICSTLGVFVNGLLKAIVDGQLRKHQADFVIVAGKGVAMVGFCEPTDNPISVPVIKTYIPYESLSTNKINSLKIFFDECMKDSSLIFLIEESLYQESLSKNRIDFEITEFAVNSGVSGTEEFPVLLSHDFIKSF